MENTMVPYRTGAMDWDGLVGLLIIAGIFGGGFGFGGNAAGIYENRFLERDVWNTNTNVLSSACSTQKEVLENKFALDRDILQNRYDNAIQTNVLQNQASVNALQGQAKLDSCCCEIKSLIREDGEATRALITQNRIADLEKELNQAQTIIANTAQSQNILNSLGNFYPKMGVNPYAIYGYNPYFGTTIQ